MNMNKNVKLSILGSDLVGRAVGKVFARYRFEVIFHDRNRAVLKALASEGYKVSYDLAGAVRRSNISFICVPPTTMTGEFDSLEVEEVYSRITAISNPEFVGSESEEDFEKQPVVIGGFDNRASQTLKSLYEELEWRSCMNFDLFITNSFVAVAACEYILTVDSGQLRKII